jgi:hypothetical protein
MGKTMLALRRITALAAVLFAAAPATASAITATNARIAQHAGFVRVVVDFTGGTFQVNDADATDPVPSEGSARVVVRGSAIGTVPVDEAAHGVRVRITQGTNQLVVRLSSALRAFKYLRISGLHGPERLVLDLYSAKPPSAAAEIRSGRLNCLRLTSITADGRGFRVRGVEKDLFEGSFVLRIRDASGRVMGSRTVTARGAFNVRVPYRVARAGTGTVEGVADSAKDGSLACLVQRRVGLNP